MVANEQRWYLKASNAAERQAWLISLGTSKANAGKEEATKGLVGNILHNIVKSSLTGCYKLFDILFTFSGDALVYCLCNGVRCDQ